MDHPANIQLHLVADVLIYLIRFLDRPSLLVFSTLCKEYRDFTLPTLFKALRFQESAASTEEGLNHFFLYHTDLGKFVRHLTIYANGYRPPVPRKRPGRHFNMKGNKNLIYALERAFGEGTNVETLWLDDAYGLFAAATSPTLAQSLGQAPHLTNICLRYVDVSTFRQLFVLHHIVSLRVEFKSDERARFDAAWNNGLGLALLQSQQTLKTLTVYQISHSASFWRTQQSDKRCCWPKLEEFNLIAASTYPNASEYFLALGEAAPNLRALTYRQQDGFADPQTPHPASVFTKLTSLTTSNWASFINCNSLRFVSIDEYHPLSTIYTNARKLVAVKIKFRLNLLSDDLQYFDNGHHDISILLLVVPRLSRVVWTSHIIGICHKCSSPEYLEALSLRQFSLPSDANLSVDEVRPVFDVFPRLKIVDLGTVAYSRLNPRGDLQKISIQTAVATFDQLAQDLGISPPQLRLNLANDLLTKDVPQIY